MRQIPGGWRVVKYGETIGYVAAHTVDAAKPTTRFIAADGLPVYEKASRTANVQFVLAQGTTVTAYEGIGGWSYIYLGDVSGYVPTPFLTAKKSTPPNSAKQTGLKMDVRAIQPHITNTKTIIQSGKTFYVHTVRNVLGIQQAGTQAVYLKPFTRNATNEALTQQLTKDTGTSFIACDRTICLLKEGELISAISLPHTSRSINYFAMKRIAKGEIQVAYTDIEYDGEYQNITYSFLNYRFDAKQQTFIQTYEQTMLDGNGSNLLTRWQTETGFVVK